jgi:hypothetical protein
MNSSNIFKESKYSSFNSGRKPGTLLKDYKKNLASSQMSQSLKDKSNLKSYLTNVQGLHE